MPSIPPTASTPPITIAPSITPTASAPPVTQGPNAGYLIAIDPGHQGRGNSEQEPIGPGADESKAKVASGTQGVSTKVPEYELTLLVAFRLRDQLTARGYQVIMIRESHDVDISNRERAERATEAGADILVRLHANGSESSDAAGITTLCPSAGNPYIPHLYEPSRTLSESVQAALITATAARDRGITEADNMSGINWATIPVTIVEMGFMTNQTEDELMQTEDYQQKLVEGMANGIDEYFALASEKASSAEALLKGYPF
ncbi:MAG: N-acetylmuramoyl-L-alanine amidase [Lachnospiraceae bacterium]|jgi:N-acetylmuramoyl-L-alanine amidase|nr:N-acetylmuramoyl-L-alanine amidase [Lachnospiraceae bacterium]